MKRLAIATIFITSAIAARQTSATPIDVTANRFVELDSEITGAIPGGNSPSTALGSFVDSVTANLSDEDVTADQDSIIDLASSFLGGDGSSTVGFSVTEDEDISATSFFDVFFDLNTAHSFSLVGELFASVDGGRGLAAFNLEGPSGFSFSALDNETTSLLSSGTLLPGSYHLTVSSLMDRGGTFESGSFMGGTSSFRFSLQLREQDGPPVPEPGSLALIALGLAIAAIRKRA
jgi:hypothetical protein